MKWSLLPILKCPGAGDQLNCSWEGYFSECSVIKWIHALLIVVVSSANSLADQPRPQLQIINGSDQPVQIFWMKPDGERVPNGRIEPGDDTVITTTIGHRFLILGERDQSADHVTSSLPVQAFRIGGIPGFYTRQISAQGYPIVASASVNPYALKEAAWLIDLMLAKRPDVRRAMIDSGSRLCIMAWDEYTTDLPEFARLAERPDSSFTGISGRDFWDARARGLGGSSRDPYCSCGEENLLGYPGDPYAAENILIHEFAHNIHLRGLNNIDPEFDSRLKRTYDRAMQNGLWKGKYASVNHHEYFAEGVQSWFDNNRENDHDHNHVNTRAELIEYDPGLAEICREVFGDTELTYTRPETRLTGHLEGFDPRSAPTFQWPARLKQAKEQIRRHAEERERKATSASDSSLDGAMPPARDIQDVAGWKVHIDRALIMEEPGATQEALHLLLEQLEEIQRVVPDAAVAELRKVPLYFSPAYPNIRPAAEFHPAADWLRSNHRDPEMAGGIEFTNILIFAAERERMPNFALHELAHAYHFHVVHNGFRNDEIASAFARAQASGVYDRVERRHGGNRPGTFERAYAMSTPQEYFAENSEAFFSVNDYFPFDRTQLQEADPEMAALLRRLWQLPPSPENDSTAGGKPNTNARKAK